MRGNAIVAAALLALAGCGDQPNATGAQMPAAAGQAAVGPEGSSLPEHTTALDQADIGEEGVEESMAPPLPDMAIYKSTCFGLDPGVVFQQIGVRPDRAEMIPGAETPSCTFFDADNNIVLIVSVGPLVDSAGVAYLKFENLKRIAAGTGNPGVTGYTRFATFDLDGVATTLPVYASGWDTPSPEDDQMAFASGRGFVLFRFLFVPASRADAFIEAHVPQLAALMK